MKKKYSGMISAFVMIMFGMITICYLMGFTNAWSSYTSRDVNDSNITKEGAINENIGDMMINGIKALFIKAGENPIATIVGSIIAGAGMILVGKAGGAQAFAYIIPIALVVLFANIFLFPISPISGEVSTVAGGVPVDLIMVAFFNLFLFLSIIDFISGGRT